MTYSDWDDTPWAGTQPETNLRVLPPLKAVTGAGVISMTYDPPLSLLVAKPQDRFAMYLRAYRHGWFYKAEARISRDFGALDWSLQVGDQTLPKPSLSVPPDTLLPQDRIQRLLERPNPRQTRRQLWEKTLIRLDMTGNAFWYYDEPDEYGLPTSIWPISPHRMTPSYAKGGALVGWVMDADGRGGGVPFAPDEIEHFAYAGPDDDIWGVGVVEAVYTELSISQLINRHTADLLTTGGRLAGAVWPKTNSLDEDQYQDVIKAWRNVASDPNAARRLLVFPEPMEWDKGAATPAELALVDLANLNRDAVLSAFPIGYTMLGGSLPAGLNSGEARRYEQQDYWEATLHPRVELFEESVQLGLIRRLEQLVGQDYDFEIEEPNLDDAAAIVEKSGALRALVNLGFDIAESVSAVGLDHIGFDQAKLAASVAPVAPDQNPDGLSAGLTAGNVRKDGATIQQEVVKSRDDIVATAATGAAQSVAGFLKDQRERIIRNVTNLWPAQKRARKALPEEWWDAAYEDSQLRLALSFAYRELTRESLQSVANRLGRVITKSQHLPIAEDVLRRGQNRITGINEVTRRAIDNALVEGIRRGYSIAQVVDGVPAEGFVGLKNLSLDNGAIAWSEYRAEMIARTETATAYNRAALDSYRTLGVKRVRVTDGDGDDLCAPWHNWEGPVDEAPEETGHPNCTRDFAPIVEDRKSLER